MMDEKRIFLSFHMAEPEYPQRNGGNWHRQEGSDSYWIIHGLLWKESFRLTIPMVVLSFWLLGCVAKPLAQFIFSALPIQTRWGFSETQNTLLIRCRADGKVMSDWNLLGFCEKRNEELGDWYNTYFIRTDCLRCDGEEIHSFIQSFSFSFTIFFSPLFPLRYEASLSLSISLKAPWFQSPFYFMRPLYSKSFWSPEYICAMSSFSFPLRFVLFLLVPRTYTWRRHFEYFTLTWFEMG